MQGDEKVSLDIIKNNGVFSLDVPDSLQGQINVYIDIKDQATAGLIKTWRGQLSLSDQANSLHLQTVNQAEKSAQTSSQVFDSIGRLIYQLDNKNYVTAIKYGTDAQTGLVIKTTERYAVPISVSGLVTQDLVAQNSQH